MLAYVYADCDLETLAESDLFNVKQFENDILDLRFFQVVNLQGDRHHLDCFFHGYFVFRRVWNNSLLLTYNSHERLVT